MLLSIVMMAKNEEKFIYKTLDALKPLMERIDSELILLDTGSTDNTVEIAKQFTEKVYFKEWNNDFADMRNISISYAKGDWLLIIDADEVLTKFDRLIEFFESGESEKYNTGSIKLKNYTSNDLKEYNYMGLNRLFRNGDFKYEGSIHEQPIYKAPVYNEIVEFDHYGYIFEDEEFKIKKMERNEVLLFDELKKNTNDPYINYQLGKNFMVLNKNEQALVYMQKSKKLYEKINVIATYVYTSLCRIYLKLGKNREVENVCLNYIKKNNKNIDIYFYLSQAQINLGKIEKSIKSLEKYLYLVKNYEITEQANSIFADDDTSRLKDDGIIALMKLYYSMDNHEKVLDLFEYIDDNEKRKKAYYHLFMAVKNLKKYELLLNYYEDIKDFKNNKDSYYYALEVLEKSLLEEEKNYVYKILSNIEGNYGLLNKFRCEKHINIDEVKKILKEEKDTIYGSIINLAIDQDIDLIELLKELDSVWIEKFVSYAIGYDRKITIDLYKYIMNLPINFDLENLRIYNILYKTVVYSNSLSPEKYKELFFIYNMYSYKYLMSLYNGFDDKKVLRYLNSDTDRFTVEFRRLVQFKNKKSLDYISELKRVLNEYPFYKKILDILIEDAEKNINEVDEFLTLKNKLILNVETMVASGNLINASNTLDEYCKSFNIDERILNIKGVIAIMEDKIEDANLYLIKAISLDIYNEDVIYNIEYIRGDE